jgi:hypothetical protein
MIEAAARAYDGSRGNLVLESLGLTVRVDAQPGGPASLPESRIQV